MLRDRPIGRPAPNNRRHRSNAKHRAKIVRLGWHDETECQASPRTAATPTRWSVENCFSLQTRLSLSIREACLARLYLASNTHPGIDMGVRHGSRRTSPGLSTGCTSPGRKHGVPGVRHEKTLRSRRGLVSRSRGGPVLRSRLVSRSRGALQSLTHEQQTGTVSKDTPARSAWVWHTKHDDTRRSKSTCSVCDHARAKRVGMSPK